MCFFFRITLDYARISKNKHSNKMSILFQLSISFALLFSAMSSFPTGAPLDRCDSMFPGHGVDPIDGQAPYEILVKPKGSEVDGN